MVFYFLSVLFTKCWFANACITYFNIGGERVLAQGSIGIMEG